MKTDPANLPNFKHPDYQYFEPILNKMGDIYNDLYRCKSTYLPRAQREPDSAYSARVERSTFDNKVRPAIATSVGLLSEFELSNLPLTLEAFSNNVDGKGTDAKTFFMECDRLSLRDGWCVILSDSDNPQSDEERTAADDLINPIRPYWQVIERSQLLNWRSHFNGARLVIDQVTILINHIVPSGEYGIDSIPQYHRYSLLEQGVRREILAINQVDGEAVVSNVEPPIVRTNINEIPITFYPYANKPFCRDMPPYYKAAELNLKLFRKESNFDELEYRINCPTVYRKSPDLPSDRPPIIFGPTWIIELMPDDDVGVLEINGSSLDSLQQSITRTREDIDRETIGFLGGGQAQRTATEAYLNSSSTQATLSSFARAKQSAILKAIAHWCLFSGEEAESVEVSMDHSVMEMPLDANEMKQLLDYYNSDTISHQTLLELLKMGRQLPPNFDVSEELERVENGRSRDMEPPVLTPGMLADEDE